MTVDTSNSMTLYPTIMTFYFQDFLSVHSSTMTYYKKFSLCWVRKVIKRVASSGQNVHNVVKILARKLAVKQFY